MKPFDLTKKIWAFTNSIFVLNYSLYLSSFIIYHPIPPLPPLFNIILLTISYSTSLFKLLRTPSVIPNQSNFYCILVFITLPSNILLIPFYFLSLYHLISFILSNKNIFEKYFIYKACIVASNFHVALGRTALFSKIICVVVSFIFFIFGSGSIGTFLMYLWMVRQEYITIPAMRSVFGELRIRLDEGMMYLPENMQYFYNKFKELLIHYDKIMK